MKKLLEDRLRELNEILYKNLKKGEDTYETLYRMREVLLLIDTMKASGLVQMKHVKTKHLLGLYPIQYNIINKINLSYEERKKPRANKKEKR